MNKPYLSVVMPTHNRAHFLNETIDSVLNQTFSDFEYIIIDDASTDNTESFLRELKDPRIRIYRNSKNTNCTFCNHNGQNLAKGKYIAHLDDDDVLYPDKFEKQLNFLEKNKDIKLLGTFIETFGENQRPSWVFYKDFEVLDFAMNLYNPLCHSSIIYDKEFAESRRINYNLDYKCSEDYDLYKQFILQGGLIANLDEIMCRYRMHKIRLTDINESRQIMEDKAEIIKTELLKRFLSDDEIKTVRVLLKDFPFNEYKTEDVERAFGIIKTSNRNKGLYNPEAIDVVLNDIRNGRYKF